MQMGIFRANPKGRVFPGGLSGSSPRGSTIGFASFRAPHPGKPAPQPRGVLQQPARLRLFCQQHFFGRWSQMTIYFVECRLNLFSSGKR